MSLGAVAGCTPATGATLEGRFVMAGPVNAVAQDVSVRWQYGLVLSVEQQEIQEIRFSCEPIPGTSFSVKGSELKRLSNGALYVEGPVLKVAKESTHWLFEATTTTAECRAVVSASDQRQAVIIGKVGFSGPVKATLLQQMEIAQKVQRPSALGKDWRVGHNARDDQQHVTEYVLEGQTVTNWTELLTRQMFAVPAGSSLNRLLDAMRQRFGPDCKDLQWTVIRQTDAEALYAWSHAGCATFPAQAERALITRLPKKLCRWSYTTKSPPLSREFEEQLDSQLGALPCD